MLSECPAVALIWSSGIPDVQVIKVHPVATDLENVSQEEVIEIYQHLATDLDRSDYNIKMVIF